MSQRRAGSNVTGRRGRGLTFESLEARCLLAGDVTARLIFGSLWITGDSSANDLVITADPVTPGKLTIASGEDATAINGSLFAQTFQIRRNIDFRLKAGDDRVQFDGQLTGRAPRDVLFDGGDGDNFFELYGYDIAEDLTIESGRASIGNTVRVGVIAPVKLADDLVIKNGHGPSTIQVGAVSIGADLKIHTGGGPDAVWLGAAATGSLTVSDDTDISTGRGDDVLRVGGDGGMSTFLGKIEVHMGWHDDIVTVGPTITPLRAGQFRFDGGHSRSDIISVPGNIAFDSSHAAASHRLRNFELVLTEGVEPVANDDDVFVQEDSAANTLDVLSNDLLRSMGGTLTVASVGPSDAGGAVLIAAAGKKLSYTPAADFFGTEAFAYTISDGLGGTDQANVTIHVLAVDDPPVLVTNTLLIVNEGGSQTIDETLLRAADVDTTNASLIFTPTRLPDHGILRHSGITLGLGGAFTQHDLDSGLIAYQHDGSETTSDSVAFSISDDTTTIPNNTYQIMITPVNDAPVVENQTFAVRAGSVDGVVVGKVQASDPEMGLLTYALVAGGDAGLFAINFNTGDLSVPETSVLVANTMLQLTVHVTDTGTPDQNDMATITINVLPALQESQVAFDLQITDLAGNPISSVQVGQDFELRAFVEDVRAARTGVFAAYADFTYTNADKVSIIYGETQRLQLTDHFHGQVDQNGDVIALDFTGGSFTLTLNNQTTAPILVSQNLFLVTSNLRTALEDLLGTGNVTVVHNPLYGHGSQNDINYRWDITFVGNLQATSLPEMTVNASSLITTDGVPSVAGVTELYLADLNNRGTFVSAFMPGELYGQGRAGINELSSVLSEVGSFSNRFSFTLQERFQSNLLFRIAFNANALGQVTFTASAADLAKQTAADPGGVSDVLVFTTQPSEIPTDRIDYGLPVTINIVAASAADSRSAFNDTGSEALGHWQTVTWAG